MTALTPDEARLQTCPLIRYCSNFYNVAAGDQSSIYEHAACQGPDCKIGWRWLPKSHGVLVREKGSDGPFEKLPWDPRSADAKPEWVDRHEFREIERRGYCGFAGQPGAPE